MSLQNAKMPRLIDKLEDGAEIVEALREKEERKDSALEKMIKKVTTKKK